VISSHYDNINFNITFPSYLRHIQDKCQRQASRQRTSRVSGVDTFKSWWKRSEIEAEIKRLDEYRNECYTQFTVSKRTTLYVGQVTTVVSYSPPLELRGRLFKLQTTLLELKRAPFKSRAQPPELTMALFKSQRRQLELKRVPVKPRTGPLGLKKAPFKSRTRPLELKE
jgi:hypothetical protein